MPRKTIDYSKCIIYKIQHIERDDLLYVGHTTDFTHRKNTHKHCSTNEALTQKLYKTIRENGGWDMFRMTPIKEFSCNSKIEAQIEENKCITELKASLNMYKATSGLTPEEYAIYYRNTNKAKIADTQLEYYTINKEEINKKHRDYRNRNKEKINEKQKQFRLENKDRLTEKVTCECGKNIQCRAIYTHNKSIFHKKYIENKNKI